MKIGRFVSRFPVISMLLRGKKKGKLSAKRRLSAILFNESWYLSQNGDLASSQIDPLEHYCLHGWREGRWPNPIFDPTWYMQQNPDVARLNSDPLAHFVEYGRFEGRHPCAAFDPAEYLRKNPNIATQGLEPCEHYVRRGHATPQTGGNQVFSLDAALAAASDKTVALRHDDLDQTVVETLTKSNEGTTSHAVDSQAFSLDAVIAAAYDKTVVLRHDNLEQPVAEIVTKLEKLDQSGVNWRDHLLAKRIHYVDEPWRPVPDGLSLAYIELADKLNDREWNYELRITAAPHNFIDGVEALIQREIGESVKLEHQLLNGSIAQ